MLESVPDDISNAKYYAKYIDYLKNSLTSNDHFYSSCRCYNNCQTVEWGKIKISFILILYSERLNYRCCKVYFIKIALFVKYTLQIIKQ